MNVVWYFLSLNSDAGELPRRKHTTFIGHSVKIRFRNLEGETQTAWPSYKPTCLPEEKKEY